MFNTSRRPKASGERCEGEEGEAEGLGEVADMCKVLHPSPSEPTAHSTVSLLSVPCRVSSLELFSSVSYNRQTITNSFQVHGHEPPNRPKLCSCQCSLILFDTSPWAVKPVIGTRPWPLAWWVKFSPDGCWTGPRHPLSLSTFNGHLRQWASCSRTMLWSKCEFYFCHRLVVWLVGTSVARAVEASVGMWNQVE